jgi:hypothetical protein
MRIDIIKEIGIDDLGRLFITPEKERFTLIYRSAAEVHWDDSKSFLYSPKPREWTYLDWFNHIISVVKTDYGVDLYLTKNTLWIDIPELIKEQIQSGAKSH